MAGKGSVGRVLGRLGVTEVITRRAPVQGAERARRENPERLRLKELLAGRRGLTRAYACSSRLSAPRGGRRLGR